MPVSMQSLLLAESEVATQFALVLLWGVVWSSAIRYLTHRVIKPWVSTQPWKSQFVQLSARSLETFGVRALSQEHYFDMACETISICSQHAIGGALCLPSVLGAPGHAAATMARHGALCEAAYEAQDLAVRLGQVLFGGEEGRAKNPRGFLMFVVGHHALGMGLVLPMNLMYGDNRLYHEMVFLLQFAGGVAGAAQSYGFTLDVKSAEGLFRMRLLSVSVLIIMSWSRVLRYLPLAFVCLSTVYHDGHIGLLLAACPALCSMGAVNFVMTGDAVRRALKYARARLEPRPAEKSAGSTLLDSRSVVKSGSKRPEEQVAVTVVQRR